MRTKTISVKEVAYTAYSLAVSFMSWSEPIPTFGSRFPNVLESCLDAPFQTFNRKNLYRGLTGKSAILFYLMVKNHPFQNGNKRIAVMTLLLFLYKNGKWLDIDNKQLYNIALTVASSNPKSRNVIISSLEKTLTEHLTDYPSPKLKS